MVLGVMEAAEATVGALGLGSVMGGFLEEAFQEGKDTAGGRYSPCEDPMVGGSLAPLKDGEKPCGRPEYLYHVCAPHPLPPKRCSIYLWGPRRCGSEHAAPPWVAIG